MSEELDLTAYCGLYCGDCIRYRSKASDLARSLLEELTSTEFGEYARIKSSPARQLDAVSAFSHFREACEVLQAVTDLQCNTPCREGGGCSSFSCTILECCTDKGFEGCWQCDSFETCEKLDNLTSIHGDSPRQNLRIIAKNGLPGWSGNRSKPYIWQQ
ncbi:MAG: DUF3795 domain-containing protein [Dehalococcoidales bacterium]|nr:DUF3795 domain-containing protein [Dehalococcoidales bacterium]